MIERKDSEHLQTATALGRVLYTHNLGDFCRLHAEWASVGRQHAGIIVAPQQRYSVGEELRRMAQLTRSISAEEMRNRLEFLSAW